MNVLNTPLARRLSSDLNSCLYGKSTCIKKLECYSTSELVIKSYVLNHICAYYNDNGWDCTYKRNDQENNIDVTIIPK